MKCTLMPLSCSFETLFVIVAVCPFGQSTSPCGKCLQLQGTAIARFRRLLSLASLATAWYSHGQNPTTTTAVATCCRPCCCCRLPGNSLPPVRRRCRRCSFALTGVNRGAPCLCVGFTPIVSFFCSDLVDHGLCFCACFWRDDSWERGCAAWRGRMTNMQ